MKKLLQALALLMTTMPAMSQTDTVNVSTEKKTSLQLGVNSKEGGFAKVETEGDSTGTSDPIRIELKRKIITIHSEPKPWTSVKDSLADELKDLKKERRRKFTYWSGLDLGVNTLLGPDHDADLSGDAEFLEINNARSRFFAINFMERKLEFGTHHAGLMTGLGVEFTSYHFRNNVLLRYDADSVFALDVERPEFRKNKLRQIGLRLPLMLEFNTKRAPLPTEEELLAGKIRGYSRKGNVHLAAGVIGSWYFDTMYKQRYRGETGRMRTDKDTGDYHLLPYQLAASVRVGFGALNLFAEYSLTPLFREDRGPEVIPFNVGLTIIGFN